MAGFRKSSKTTHTAEQNNANLIQVIDNYVRYYAAGSSHTARAKRQDLQHFVRFLLQYKGCRSQSLLKVKDWDYSSVQRFVEERLLMGESPTTVARRLATIKHMGRTLAEKIAGFTNPAREVKPPKIQTPQAKALTRTEIQQILDKAQQRLSQRPSFIRFRNQVIFCLMLDTGLRADEIRLLKMSQLGPELNWISGVRTKGRRYRNVYITTALRDLLKSYLLRREEELQRFFSKITAYHKKLPVFISSYKAQNDKPDSFLLSPKTLWRAINELSTKTKLHPHLLRHSYAIDLLDSSKDVRLVSQALGHSDVRTTMRYTQRQDIEIAAALEKSRSRK